jgi:DNA (cytosine-5)-methyltransferase 1
MGMSAKKTFTFADLFAGIGGMRLGFEEAGGTCVLTSEIDDAARTTYKYHFEKNECKNHQYIDDVVKLGNLKKENMPEFDVLVAGFPCQPYSIAGLRQGLNDEKGRGQVFLSILKILKKAEPDAFLLENVKGMLSHDRGETMAWMRKKLTGCGYSVLAPKVLNSMVHGGVPQNRERVFLIGFKKGIDASSFRWPSEIPVKRPLSEQLEKIEVDEKYYYTNRFECFKQIKEQVTNPNTAYQWRRVYVRENKSGVCPALTANMGSGGHNVPLVKVATGIRKLTPRECANLQGFNKNFKFPPGMSDSHLYHQFGNSVTVPLIARLAKQMQKVISDD